MNRNSISIGIILVLFVIIVVESSKFASSFRSNCRKPRDGRQICTCGKDKILYDRLKDYICYRGQVVRADSVQRNSSPAALRSASVPIHYSTRDQTKGSQCVVLKYNKTSSNGFVPLQNVSVEAWIDSFTADVTLTQVFVNREDKPIEAIYIFPIEENAAIYSFTAQIGDRTIVAQLKERKKAETEYQTAIRKGQSAILMRQSDKTFDTFTINVGALPPGKECRITVKYVTELDLVDKHAIRFVVPTTIAPRYNPSLGRFQSPDNQTSAEYVQNTSYSIVFEAHIDRGDNYKILHFANRSHPVYHRPTQQAFHVVSKNHSLDRDFILDIDLPQNRPLTSVTVEKYNDTAGHAILLAFTPRLSDVTKAFKGDISKKEFIFIVDCSGSMHEANGIGLAREAMLLFIRGLPVGVHFNIIRFGSKYDILFKNEGMTAVYNQTTALLAETLAKSMDADLGGTEILAPLKYLKDHPPVKGRSREIFVLTDGEVSNTDEVIELCRSMSSDTRIFSFGLGYSPSRALVKGLARATNGHFVIVEPNAKVDTYVGSQFSRAIQPAIVHARLQWHGLPGKSLQAPRQIAPLYVNDRVLVYRLLEKGELTGQNVSVDLMVDDIVINSIRIPTRIVRKRDTIRRLAAKAWMQELLHEKNESGEEQSGEGEYQEEEEEEEAEEDNGDDKLSTAECITRLSLEYQILSPYTAFVGVETTGPKVDGSQLQVRYVPIQITKDDEYASSQLPSMSGMPGLYGASQQKYHAAPPPRSTPFQSLATPMAPVQMADMNRDDASDEQPAAMSGMGTRDDSTTDKLLSTDPVRWLISKQSFNGVWVLSDNEIRILTNQSLKGKLKSTITTDSNALTTAFAIAYLETKQQNQRDLWSTLVNKARKQLVNYGLSQNDIQSLVNEFQTQLKA